MIKSFLPIGALPGRPASRIVADTGRSLAFITVSQQVGVGFTSLLQRLVHAINATSPAEEPGWSAWDHELIDRVATDYGIPVQTIERVEQFGYS